MTDTFTPPTSFPHECRDERGNTVWLHGLSKHPEWDFTYVGEAVVAGEVMLGRWEPASLRNKPEVTSTWTNLYPDCVSVQFSSRQIADRCALPNRINVLRQDTTDGVTTYKLEKV